MTSEKSNGGKIFLGISILIFIVIIIIKPESIIPITKTFGQTILKVIPIIIFIILLMTITEYYVKPKQLVKYLGKKSGIKGWIIAIIAGTISTGPIYVWYPMLNELQKHKIRNGLIATFLYNRSIKIPLIPLIIFYFGLTYTIILTITIILMSVAQGWITEKIVEMKI